MPDPSQGEVDLIGNVGGTIDVATVGGVATFAALELRTAGNHTLSFCEWKSYFVNGQARGECGLQAVADPVAVVPGHFAQLKVMDPTLEPDMHIGTRPYAPEGSTANEPLAYAVRLVDAFDNTVVDPIEKRAVTVAVDSSVAPSNASVGGVTSVQTDAGVAVFAGIFAAGPKGTYRLRFVAEGPVWDAGVGAAVTRNVTVESLDFAVAARVATLQVVTTYELDSVNRKGFAMIGGEPFFEAPVVHLIDEDGLRCNTSRAQLNITARFVGAGPQGSTQLAQLGARLVTPVHGVVSFSDFGVSHPIENQLFTISLVYAFTDEQSAMNPSVEVAAQQCMVTFPANLGDVDGYAPYVVKLELGVPWLGDAPEQSFIAGSLLAPIVAMIDYGAIIGNGIFVGRTRRDVEVEVHNLTACSEFSLQCLGVGGARVVGTTRRAIGAGGQAVFDDLRVETTGLFELRVVSRGSPEGDGIAISQTTNVFEVTQTPARRIGIFRQPDDAIAGEANPGAPVLVTYDQFGNVATDATERVEVVIGANVPAPAGSDCWTYTAEGEWPRSDVPANPLCAQILRQETPEERIGSFVVEPVRGVAQLDCIAIDRTGEGYTLKFQNVLAPGETRFPIVSRAFTVSPGIPRTLEVFVEPMVERPIAAGVSLALSRTPVVGLVDRLGNLVYYPQSVSVAGAVLPSASGCVFDCQNAANSTLLGVVTSPFEDGIARFTHAFISRANPALVLRFSATVGGLAMHADSVPFHVVHAAAARALVLIAQPAKAVQADRFPVAPSARLLDAFGNTVYQAVYQVRASIVCEGGAGCEGDRCAKAQGTSLVHTVSGVATFKNLFTSAQPGMYRLRFDVGRLVSVANYPADVVSQEAYKEFSVMPVWSEPFQVTSKPWELALAQSAWGVCAPAADEAACDSLGCTWHNATARCVGLRDSTAADALFEQPTLLLVDANGTLVNVSVLGAHFVLVSLLEGVAGATGERLQGMLTGTRRVPIVDGVAQYTDLGVAREAQGLRFHFTVDEDCCLAQGGTLGGMQVVSPPINVYNEPKALEVMAQPPDGVAGERLAASVDVAVKDTSQVALYATWTLTAELVGSQSPRCPDDSKTLHIAPARQAAAWALYAGARGAPAAMDFDEFNAMLVEELLVTAADADVRGLFVALDTGGRVDAENNDVPDGVLDEAEFREATEQCVCLAGWGMGTYKIENSAAGRVGDVVIVPTQQCVLLQKCPAGFLGRQCRKATALIPRSIPRLPRLVGTLSTQVKSGVARFTDLTLFEAGSGFRLRFYSPEHPGTEINSAQFNVIPAAPVQGAYLSPEVGSTFRAGEVVMFEMVVADVYWNFQPLSTGLASLTHADIQKYSSECNVSTQILPCDSCPEREGNVKFCPGPRCPFRCSYENALRRTSWEDPRPWGQACAYNCKKGCSFMCGTLSNITMVAGRASFNDVVFKRVGQHEMRNELIGVQQVGNATMIDWVDFAETQRRLNGRLLLLPEDPEKRRRVSVQIRNGPGVYLVSDFGPALHYLTSNTTRAGAPLDPHPACLVLDRFGNRAVDGRFRVGLGVRDSDRDEIDAAAAKRKYITDPATPSAFTDSGVVGWPAGTGKLVADFVHLDFDASPMEADQTADDVGCVPPLMDAPTTPEGGCRSLASDIDSIISREGIISPEWCPSTQEKRFCRTCLTGHRQFTSFNSSHWKQQYEFANSSIRFGFPQFTGAFDCPTRTHCTEYFPERINCGCLIELHNATRGAREFDLCQDCATRSLPSGMPVADTVAGRAVFKGITCSRPRRGYRFQCIAPPGGQGNGLEDPYNYNNALLIEVAWDRKETRNPLLSFTQDTSWGRYEPMHPLSWVDSSGNEHPQMVECTALCVNRTIFTSSEVTPQGKVVQLNQQLVNNSCPDHCFKFSFPVKRNPSWNFVPSESPALSVPVRVRAGDVTRLLVTKPQPDSIVRVFDASRPREETSSFVSLCGDAPCDVDLPSFKMVDRFDNLNTTSVGMALANLVPTSNNVGAEILGRLTTPLVDGRATFSALTITCPGLAYRLELRYRRWLYGLLAVPANDVVALSPAFDVVPAAPRLEAVRWDDSYTSVLFEFDRSTNRGGMELSSDCSDLLDGVARYGADGVWRFTPVCDPGPANASCQVSRLLGERFPPVCSWSSSKVLRMDLGSNALLLPDDMFFLKHRSRARGRPVELRVEVTVEGKQLRSPPMEVPTATGCNGTHCASEPVGGYTLMRNCKLEEVLLPAGDLGGDGVTDAVQFAYRGRHAVAVANKCMSTEPCAPSQRAVIIYELHFAAASSGGVPQLDGLTQKETLPMAGAVDVETFRLLSDSAAAPYFLAIARHADGVAGAQAVDIFTAGNPAEEVFKLEQKVPTAGALTVRYAAYGRQDYLMILQSGGEVLLLRWLVGFFATNPLTGEYRFFPGYFTQIRSFRSTGVPSGLTFVFSEGSWVLIISNEKSRTERCSAKTCRGDGLTYRAAVDFHRVGAFSHMARFEPYPASVNQDICTFFTWSLEERYANITLVDVDAAALETVKVGTYLRVNGETVRVVDPAVAESDLAGLDGIKDPFLPAFDQMAAAEFARGRAQEFAQELQLGPQKRDPPGWFRVPMGYREAWAALPGDRARVGKFAELLSRIEGSAMARPTAPAAADVTGDGVPDLVVGTWDGRLRVFPGGAGGLAGTELNASAPEYPFRGIRAASGGAAPAFGDFDGDGRADLVVGEADGSLRFFRNAPGNASNASLPMNGSNGTALPLDFRELLGAARPFVDAAVGAAASPALGDLNGDGALDLVVGAADGSLLIALAGRNASVEPPLVRRGAGSFAAPAVADLDGDGRPDLLVGGGDGFLVVHLAVAPAGGAAVNYTEAAAGASPGGITVTLQSMNVSGERASPALLDVDGDGRLELVLGHSYGDLEVYAASGACGAALLPCEFVPAAAPAATGGEAPLRTVSRAQYAAVFTGFRCMRPVCTNCTGDLGLCDLTPCHRINDDFSQAPPASGCTTFAPVDDGPGGCCELGPDSGPGVRAVPPPGAPHGASARSSGRSCRRRASARCSWRSGVFAPWRGAGGLQVRRGRPRAPAVHGRR